MLLNPKAKKRKSDGTENGSLNNKTKSPDKIKKNKIS